RTAREPSGSPSTDPGRPRASRSHPRRASRASSSRSTSSAPVPRTPPARAAGVRERACAPAAALEGLDHGRGRRPFGRRLVLGGVGLSFLHPHLQLVNEPLLALR